MHSRWWVAVGAVLVLGTVGCSGPASDAASLRAALDDANPGDEVRVAEGRFVGPFVVPAGVQLVGEGAATILVAPEDGVAVELSGGSPASILAAVAIESAGRGGVAARGSGSVEIRDVTVTATRGAGIGAEGLTRLTLENVTVTGPVTPENAATIPADPDMTNTALYGILLLGISDATLTNVNADGFAEMGLAAVDTTVRWDGGGTDHNLGVGAFFSGGDATLTSLAICGTLEGVRLPPAYGAVAAGGARLTSQGLTVCDNEGNGFLHDGAEVQHTDLTARDNTFGALWVQAGASFLLDGSSALQGNAFAGLVGVASSGIEVTGASIDMQSTARRVFDETRAVDVGDGIQLVGSTTGISITDTSLTGNERVGILIDGAGESLESIDLQNVSVDGGGAQLGVIAQNGVTADGWDDGIDRAVAIESNDLSFSGTLDVVSIVGPSRIPAGATFGDGLDAIVGPSR